VPKPRKDRDLSGGDPVPSAILEKLDRALSQVDRPGTFCVSGKVPAVLPGLEVEGLGPVALPLTTRTAKDLIKHCHQAPYGQGEKTLVDPSVRRVWRLQPDHFQLENPDWDRVIRDIVARVQEELGLEGQKLESHLYDLLLYEKGSFFLPHRDGEKRDRMVATLVVVLPSAHEGGELIVRHDSEERTLDLGGSSGDTFHIHYAAFYADCEHEVRPLKKGYRLCLVYNLTLAKSKKTMSAPRVSEHIGTIAPLIRQWASDEESTEKLAIPLDHQYSQEGLSWDSLKGTDRAKARVLADAARQAGCKAYLAILTLHQSGEGEEPGGGYGYGRGRWYDRYEEDDDEAEDGEEDTGEEDTGGEYTMVEVYDTDLTANHWSDPEGNRLPMGELTIEEDEVLDPDSLTGVKPEEDFQGYTGNEGTPLDRWYRHAAIFLWPEARHFEIICSRDSRGVVPELARMIGRRKSTGAGDRPALEAQCRRLAAAIIARWPAQEFARSEEKIEGSPAATLLECLAALDAPELIGDFLGTALIKDVSADPSPSIVAIGQKFGWPTFQPKLVSVMKETTTVTMERNVRLTETIATARPRKKDGWQELCAALARELVTAIEALDSKRSPAGYDDEWYPRKVDRAGILAGLARSLIATGQSEVMAHFIDHALATPKRYPLTEAHIKAIVDLVPWLKKHARESFPALTRWVDGVREQLESLTAREPQEPKDFRRAAAIACTCELCEELKRFLKDPHESVHRFRVRKELRRHLHSQIDSNKIDLIHVTDRRGSPQTLVCTKNTASYQASLKKYHEDREHLETINAIGKGLPK
jgi:hypothetical protein